MKAFYLGALLLAAAACAASPKPKPAMSADDAPTPSEQPADPDAASPWSEPTKAEADGGAGSEPAAAGAAPLGSEESAKAMLAQFTSATADHAALTRSLRPTSADYKALFDTATAPKIEAGQAKDWDSGKAAIKPKPTQTEIKVWSASGADIAAWKGNAKEFPTGYKKIGKHLSGAVMFFRFKFVEPGKDAGTAYDGLAYVNGHWVITPKPWRALEAKKDDDDGAAPAKPTKKPKGKKKK